MKIMYLLALMPFGVLLAAPDLPSVQAETVPAIPPRIDTTILPELAHSPVPESLTREARAAVERSVAWLKANQQEGGHWSNPDFPALTALPVWALAKNGVIDDPAIQRATDYLVSTFNENGSFCREPSEKRKGGGLCNYNTALTIVALHATGNPDFISKIQQGRTFLAGIQHFGDDIYHGGMGYDAETGRAYADLSNSTLAFEAMRLTENVEDLRTETGTRADLDWAAAAAFIERVQNRPESNDQDWASDDPAEYGGFAYRPDASMAGAVTNEAGEVRLRSYGSMTYAGLLSFIYADVDKSDPRVQSAYEWATKHWTLEENPGMGAQGLYYYYHTLAKAMAAMDVGIVTLTESGEAINWRTELIKTLVGRQKIAPDGTGFWVNEENRWWEADPTLVTAYTLLALAMALPD
jgi:squalene-hopene/tetraprenyl-beta-curcumene cyclase